jgi:hypothetical protein
MRRFLVTAGLAALVCGGLVAMSAPAGAATADGCGGTGVSFDSEGERQDSANAPGRGGTKSNPFDVWADGTVEYTTEFDATSAGEWDLKIQKTPISFSDDIKADAGPTDEGTEQLDDHFQPGGVNAIIGLYKVDIKANRGGTPCVVSGWIHVHGSLIKAPLFWLALIFIILGLWFLLPLLRA